MSVLAVSKRILVFAVAFASGAAMAAKDCDTSAVNPSAAGKAVVKPTQTLDQIFEKAVSDLDKAMIRDGENADGFIFNYKGVRSKAMELEELARFYQDLPGQKTKLIMIGIKSSVKELEDRLGKIGAIDDAYQINKSKKLYGILQSMIAEHRQWLLTAPPLIPGIRLALKNADLPDIEKNRDYVLRRMQEKLRDLPEDMKEGKYSPSGKVYSEKELEKKAHELRRDLRRITILMAVTGQFKLSNEVDGGSADVNAILKRFEYLKTDAIADSPYAKLPGAKTALPILVPRVLFLLITKVVNDIGIAKDEAINQNIFFDNGLADHGADLEALTRAVLPQIELLVQSKALEALAESLR